MMDESELHEIMKKSLDDEEMKEFLDDHDISLEEAESMTAKFTDLLLALDKGLLSTSDLRDWIKHMDVEWKNR